MSDAVQPKSIQPKDFINNLLILLTETVEGAPKLPTAYLDAKASFFHTFQDISAEQASTPVTSDGMTIAAHVEHSRFYMEVLLGYMNGCTDKVDWDKSWQLKTVSADDWQTLKADFETVYQNIKIHVQNVETWGDIEVGDAMAIVVHSAYHLGAVRQMMKLLNERDDTIVNINS
ncbi:MAG: DinB family protein [Deinococcota bacterium]